ncbi:5739_t:CDS:2, partial [Dentiscutata erythropus]
MELYEYTSYNVLLKIQQGYLYKGNTKLKIASGSLISSRAAFSLYFKVSPMVKLNVSRAPISTNYVIIEELSN